MPRPILVQLYEQLPSCNQAASSEAWVHLFQKALTRFRSEVAQYYNEGTLQRLLKHPAASVREAACVALGLLGTMTSNRPLASALHDEEDTVCQAAACSLWSLWFRAEGEDSERELRRLLRLFNRKRALAGLNALLQRVPTFAEAYNQRAILHFQMGDYERAASDCELTLLLNPVHFGAQLGLAQCLLQLGLPRAALHAFQHTFSLHPTMAGVEEVIRALEETLGEEGTRDDKR